MKIIWSDNAEETFDEILDYLSNEFSEKEEINLISFFQTRKNPNKRNFLK